MICTGKTNTSLKKHIIKEAFLYDSTRGGGNATMYEGAGNVVLYANLAE